MLHKQPPPRWLDKLVERLCPSHLLEEVMGDLHERYQLRVERLGEEKARKRYWLELLPYIKTIIFQRQQTHHSKPSATDMLQNYIKIARRNVYRNKSYSLINIAGMGLGLACAILIATIVRYHLSFDTFHSNRDRIYRITSEIHQNGITREPNVPQPIGKAFSNDYTFAEKVAMVYSETEILISVPSSNDNKRFEEQVAYAERDFFDIMDFPLIRGDKKSILTEPNTAIITARIAKKYFGDQDPINQIILVENKWNFKITGILEDLPNNTDRRDEIYLSYANLKDYNAWLAGNSWPGIAGGMQCFLLMKPDVTPSDVNNSFRTLSKKYYNEKDADMFHFKLQHLSDFHFNRELEGYLAKDNLWALSLIGVVLMMTACVNFVNLATAQALKRAKEIGVRKVLGSQRLQVLWQFITETALITSLSLVVALILAQLAMPFLSSIAGILPDKNILDDPYIIIFLPLLLVVVTLLAGLYPGLVMAGYQPVYALKGKLSQKAAGGFSMRRALVVGQFAISQLLIIGTIVIASQMQYAKRADMGFTKDAIVMFPVPLREKAIINSLDRDISQIAGVENITFCSRAPASFNWASVSITYDTRTEKEPFDIVVKAADDKYVPTFNLQVITGRNIQHSDTVREFLINETAVTRLGAKTNDEVLGKKIRIGLNNRRGIIVGVVKDFHNASFHEAIDPICIASSNDWYSDFAVRINPESLTATVDAIGSIWKKTFPDRIYEYSFLNEQIARFYEIDSMNLRLIQAAAAIAIVIGCLGLYGLVSFMAAQKTKELGIRKVLGASTPNLLWLFGREFSRLLIAAFIVAAPLAWWAMNTWLSNFTYRIEIGTEIFLASIAVTFIIALFTVGYHSLKAALANPVDSLRNE